MARAQVTWRGLPELVSRAGHAMATDPLRKRVVLFGGAMVGGIGQPRLSDTWEWDGIDWVHLRPPVSPPARDSHAMAFDPVRRTVLLFGGSDGNNCLSDTWEWDGQSWTELHPPTSPPARGAMLMATDWANQRIVIFGGTSSPPGTIFYQPMQDTWVWDGMTWSEAMPTTLPPARYTGAAGSDPATGHMVMFGGFAPVLLQEQILWEWTGQDWLPHAPAVAPPPRWLGGMSYDPSTGMLMLHGGGDNGPGEYLDDTWLWDGTQWHAQHPTRRPPVRRHGALAWDAASDQVILFGDGLLGTGTPPQQDTWAWDGSDWRQAADFVMPSGDFQMTYDAARDECLLFGSERVNGRSVPETWILRGDRYVKPAVSVTPPYHDVIYLADHVASGRIVLLGRVPVPPYYVDTWSWDGSSWRQEVSGVQPPLASLTASSLVYDPVRQKLVLVDAVHSQLWDWDPSGWSVRSWSGGPPPDHVDAIAYDAGRQRLVLFDGIAQETWEWDGSQWLQRSPAVEPASRGDAELCYVPALRGCVLLGGFSVTAGTPPSDVWLWDGQSWSQLNVPPLPNKVEGGTYQNLRSAVYDSGRQRIVAAHPFFAAPRQLPTALELFVQTLSSARPYPRLGQTLPLQIRMPAQARQPFVLGLSDGNRPGIPLLPVPRVGTELLPLAPGPVLQASLLVGMGGRLDPSGNGAYSIPVPNDPSLLWRPLFAAGLVVGPSGATITNGLELRIVP